MLGTTPAASQSFEALTDQWRVDVASDPDTPLQTIVPRLALAWPLATALLVYLIGRGMLRRRRAEREVDDIFDLSLDLLCIVGVDGYLKRVNPAFERTLGYEPAELLAHPLVEFVHPDDREATTQSIAELQKGQEAEPFESRYVRADGAVRWLQWNTRPMLERGLMYAAAHDVTDTRMLVDEQAALRRVATLVAEGPDAGDLFKAVAVEVGQLLGADATRLLRYEPDGTASVVAAHGASDAELGVRAREDSKEPTSGGAWRGARAPPPLITASTRRACPRRAWRRWHRGGGRSADRRLRPPMGRDRGGLEARGYGPHRHGDPHGAVHRARGDRGRECREPRRAGGVTRPDRGHGR